MTRVPGGSNLHPAGSGAASPPVGSRRGLRPGEYDDDDDDDEDDDAMNRRSFARRLLATAGALGAPGLSGFLGACDRDDENDGEPASSGEGTVGQASGEDGGESYRFFDADQARTLTAFLDTLLPPDDPPGSPGASDAGVLTFIDRELARDEFRKFQRFFQDGAGFLDREARRLEGAGFDALGPERRTALVEKLQFGELDGGRFPGRTFFSVAHTFALEGFFSAPAPGGNRDRVAWRWAGIDVSCPASPPPTG